MTDHTLEDILEVSEVKVVAGEDEYLLKPLTYSDYRKLKKAVDFHPNTINRIMAKMDKARQQEEDKEPIVVEDDEQDQIKDVLYEVFILAALRGNTETSREQIEETFLPEYLNDLMNILLGFFLRCSGLTRKLLNQHSTTASEAESSE